MTLDCNHPNTNIQKRLESIYNLNPAKTIFRLDEGPYIDLLEKLGNPHLKCPPTIHVAGTNGKGSTIAFLKSLYEAAGKTVHAYNSPHLLTFNERITVAGHYISDETLIEYLDIIETANDGAPLTFFEYTTALAFKVFADHPADILLLETGLGGRLDCTNVIKNPIACVITAIGYDHMDWLGADIKTIAGEKAGIIKAGAPCFIAPQTHDVNQVFELRAKDVGCDIHFIKRSDDLPALGLMGDHQKDNASVALAVASFCGLTTGAQSLKTTKWPARMEKISDTPEIWFDCGHNVDGAKTIAAQFKSWKTENPSKPIHLVLGLAADKNPNEFLKPLYPFIDSLTCVDLLNARNPQSAEALRKKIDKNQTISTASDLNSAFDHKDGITFITGSLYLYEKIISLKVGEL